MSAVEPEFLKLTRVAALLGVSPRTIRAWVHAGKFPLPHSTIGQTWFFEVSLIDYWRKNGEWPRGAKFVVRRFGYVPPDDLEDQDQPATG